MGNKNTKSKNLSAEEKKKYLKAKELYEYVGKAETIEAYRLREQKLFLAMRYFKNEEHGAFYPTFAYGLMVDSLKNRNKFSNEFNYDGFFDLLLESNNKCNLGCAVYLYYYLSSGCTLLGDNPTEQDEIIFDEHKKLFFNSFNTRAEQFLDKCNELKLVPTALDNQSYCFLSDTIEQQTNEKTRC